MARRQALRRAQLSAASTDRTARVSATTQSREHRAHSYRYSEPLRADVVLPEAGVTYYDVPPEYSVRDYRYTVVNETPVLVEPRTRRVIELIE